MSDKISKAGLKVDPGKIRAIKEMNRPQNRKELQTFLGGITFLQKFLPHVRNQCATEKTLREQCGKHWDKTQEDSFNRLKEMASTAPVLAFYNSN